MNIKIYIYYMCEFMIYIKKRYNSITYNKVNKKYFVVNKSVNYIRIKIYHFI